MSIQRYPTPNEILAQLLSDLYYQYGLIGITANVKKGSDHYIRMKAIANRISLAIANGQLAVQNLSPITAQGDHLLALAAQYGIKPRPATPSRGFAIVKLVPPAGSVMIPVNFFAAAPSGVRYKTVTTAAYSNLSLVELESVEKGGDTESTAGTKLTWESASIGFLAQECTVALGGITDGHDGDGVEAVRARLLRALAAPAVGGNWSFIAEVAEGASAAVDSVFVYPTIRGPASYDIAVLGVDGEPLGVATLNAISSVVSAAMPGSTSLNLTGVQDEPLTVIVNLSLPLPVHAGGGGGGWIDAVPWPSTNETGVGVFAKVTGVGVTDITVDSTGDDPPVIGSHFAIWNPDRKKMVNFTAVGVGGAPGAYVITVDAGMVQELSWVTTDMYCSAAAEDLDALAQLLDEAFSKLGPGEKTDNPDVLVFARRRPSVSVEKSPAATSRLLTSIHARPEVDDADFAARYEAGTVNTRYNPSIPTAITNAPRRLTLENLSFRRIA